MGGERETKIAGKVIEKGLTKVGDIRIHEAKSGDAHFHSDSTGLKAAVPIAIWFKAWMELKDKMMEWTHTDIKQHTRLTVKSFRGNDGKRDIEITLVPLGDSDKFQALQAFSEP